MNIVGRNMDLDGRNVNIKSSGQVVDMFVSECIAYR
jgi:hypothetical protein